MRAQKGLLSVIEAALKDAGLPPLTWYDVLLELRNADGDGLRPMELEKRLLLPQYGMSRLLDRMQKAGLIERRKAPDDGRGRIVGITGAGRSVQADMWPVYATALSEAFASKITVREAAHLHELLARFRRNAGA